MKKALNFFLQGLLFVVPVTVTIWVLIKTILWVDSLLPFQIPIKIPGFSQLEIPGLGLLTIFIVITAIGYIGVRYIRNPLFSYLELIIDKAPLVKLIYGSVKDLERLSWERSDVLTKRFLFDLKKIATSTE